ncbi:hypothetical protein BGZ80_005023, partial [Entomortierella chlamydospora]
MEPPPQPQSGQFLKPQAPARPRPPTTGPTNDSSASTSAASSSNATIGGATGIESSQERNGALVYVKPLITPSQILPTQATQLADAIDELEQDHVLAEMRGHDMTFTTELTQEKTLYRFGISEDCDVIINHRHWQKF